MTGQMLAFDKHMNVVLADTEEFRRLKHRNNNSETVETEKKRTLGLTIVRGATIISLSAQSPPSADPSARLNKTTQGGFNAALSAGPGVAKPAGRGAPPSNLAGPAAGVGGGAPGFAPNFPGGAPPGFPGPGGRGGKSRYSQFQLPRSDIYQGPPPPGFPGGNFPPGPPGPPGGPGGPGGFPGGPPPPGFGGPGGPPPGFQPPPRR